MPLVPRHRSALAPSSWSLALLLATLALGCATPAAEPNPGAAGSGASGSSATAGSGAAGTSGTAGSAGTSGGAGDSGGASGTAGGSGAAGSSGSAGASGSAGTTGAAGTFGAAGGAPDAGTVPDDSGIVVTDPGSDGDGDSMIGPTYKTAPEMTANPNVPHGTLTMFTIASSESPIFPGVSGAYTRQGWIYIPKQYVKGTPAPLLIAQDGRDYILRIPNILDNMIAAKRVPVMIAVMVMAGPGDGPGSERGFEYDTVSDAFANWVETCVLPKMVKDYGVKFTTSPEGRMTMGGSSGAAAAFTMAWFRPNLYRKVLSFSGTFVNQQKPVDPMYPHGAWEYPEHLVADAPGKPIRMWMEVGEMDLGATRDEASMHNWIIANQKLAAALHAKGNHVHFEFAKGAAHNDAHVVDQSLAPALEYLWRGYPR